MFVIVVRKSGCGDAAESSVAPSARQVQLFDPGSSKANSRRFGSQRSALCCNSGTFARVVKRVLLDGCAQAHVGLAEAVWLN